MQRKYLVVVLLLLATAYGALAHAASVVSAAVPPSTPRPGIWLPFSSKNSPDKPKNRKTPTPTPVLPTPPAPTTTRVPGDVVAVDSFTAADNTGLAQHRTDNGLAWTVHQGTWQIINGAAQNGAGPAYASVDVGSGNVLVEADITTPPTAPPAGQDWFVGFYAAAAFSGGNVDSGVELRMLYQGHSSEFELWEWNEGRTYLADPSLEFNFANVTVPNSSDPNQPFQPGKTHHVALQLYGDKAIAYYNSIPTVMMQLGRSVGSDPTFNQTGTRVAISVDAVGIAGSRIDNFRVTRLASSPPPPGGPVCGDGQCTGGQSCNNCGACLPPASTKSCNFDDFPPTLPTYGPWVTSTPAPGPSSTPEPSGAGVPQYAVDFNKDVETWWAGSPFNPDNPDRVPVGGITNLAGLPTINVRQQYGSNLQAAIDALPATGGTLSLDAGSYSSFNLVGKNNVHFVSDGGAVIGGSSEIAPITEALNYGTFNSCSYYRDPKCISALQNQTANIYFKNITFDGGGTAGAAVDLHAVRGVVFDNVTFQNFANPHSGHGGLVNGNSTLNNVWLRNCRFVGSQVYALYLDGAHGSGVVNSTIENGFSSGGLLFLTNDDFTMDVNGNSTIDMAERRTGNYIVLYGNTFQAAIHTAVQATAANMLLKNNVALDSVTYFAAFDIRNSNRGIVYNFYGSRLVGNRTQNVTYFSEWGGQLACDTSRGQICARMGQYQVRDNVLQNAGSFQSLAVHDQTTTSQMDGPYVVSNNCVNGRINGSGAACGATSPTPTPQGQPTPARTSSFPLGVFEDGNLQSASTFGALIDDARAHNLDSVYFVNAWARNEGMLGISDSKAFDVYYNISEGLDTWFRNASVSQDIETARSIFYPLIDQVRGHPSVKGYNVVDEPTNDLQAKVALAVQAYRERDPARRVTPTLIGIGRADPIFSASKPDVMVLDVYPFAAHNAACDTTMNGFGYPTYDFVDYIRAIVKVKPAATPLWLILQSHSFGDGSGSYHLRAPTVPELREEHWLAIGEGATGLFWFIYSSEQGWTGLKDDPALFTEVSNLAKRIQPLRSLLLSLHKTPDRYTVAGSTGPAYVSTLTDASAARTYVVAVNKACASQNLMLTSASGQVQLRDLETGQTVTTGSAIPFRAGDGRIFEVIAGS